MGITTKTRKALWAKSANKCSICKTELFSNKGNNKQVNIGEECHIISSKSKGPRHIPNLDDYDQYENLILLCRNHHKQIDELVDTYTEELIRYIKSNHEKWVKDTLNHSIESRNIDKPKFLRRITSGKELFSIINDSMAQRTDYDDPQNDEETEFIGGVLQALIDYGDIACMVEPYDQVQMASQLGKLIEEIEDNGFYLFADKNLERLKFQNGDKEKWNIATILIRRKTNPEIVKFEFSSEQE